MIAKAEYDDIWDYKNGFIQVIKNDKLGYIDTAGKLITDIKYDKYSSDGFHDGMAHIAINGKYGFINTSGKEIIKLKYDDALNFVEGTAPVCVHSCGI